MEGACVSIIVLFVGACSGTPQASVDLFSRPIAKGFNSFAILIC